MGAKAMVDEASVEGKPTRGHRMLCSPTRGQAAAADQGTYGQCGGRSYEAMRDHGTPWEATGRPLRAGGGGGHRTPGPLEARPSVW